MNEVEKERILRMVAEGTLKPAEGAQLLAVLADAPPAPGTGKPAAQAKEKPKSKQPLMEVDMQRPDGSHYKVEVPSNLVPMFWQIAKVAIKESTRAAAEETWGGFKVIVRRQTNALRNGVRTRMTGGSAPAATSPALTARQEQHSEARRQILQMVQNGRISASDASRLIQQLDALQVYEQQTSAPLKSVK